MRLRRAEECGGEADNSETKDEGKGLHVDCCSVLLNVFCEDMRDKSFLQDFEDASACKLNEQRQGSKVILSGVT
jgi:hypothetical protein